MTDRSSKAPGSSSDERSANPPDTGAFFSSIHEIPRLKVEAVLCLLAYGKTIKEASKSLKMSHKEISSVAMWASDQIKKHLAFDLYEEVIGDIVEGECLEGREAESLERIKLYHDAFCDPRWNCEDAEGILTGAMSDGLADCAWTMEAFVSAVMSKNQAKILDLDYFQEDPWDGLYSDAAMYALSQGGKCSAVELLNRMARFGFRPRGDRSYNAHYSALTRLVRSGAISKQKESGMTVYEIKEN